MPKEPPDAQAAEQQLASLTADSARIVGLARALVIVDENTNAQAVALLATIAAGRKAIETQRKWFVKPLNDQVKAVNAKFAELDAPAAAADGIVRGRLLAYREQQEAARQAEERRRQAEYAQDKKDARALGMAAPAPAQPLAVAEAPRTTATEAGSATVRKVWAFEVTDLAAVPAQYKVIDEVLLRVAVRNGAREIPGVRIYEKDQLAVKTK